MKQPAWALWAKSAKRTNWWHLTRERSPVADRMHNRRLGGDSLWTGRRWLSNERNHPG